MAELVYTKDPSDVLLYQAVPEARTSQMHSMFFSHNAFPLELFNTCSSSGVFLSPEVFLLDSYKFDGSAFNKCSTGLTSSVKNTFLFWACLLSNFSVWLVCLGIFSDCCQALSWFFHGTVCKNPQVSVLGFMCHFLAHSLCTVRSVSIYAHLAFSLTTLNVSYEEEALSHCWSAPLPGHLSNPQLHSQVRYRHFVELWWLFQSVKRLHLYSSPCQDFPSYSVLAWFPKTNGFVKIFWRFM